MKTLSCPTMKTTVTMTTAMCIILWMYLHCNWSSRWVPQM
jgi:hypothetical protein